MLKYLFLFAFALASNSSYAQKMNVLDYHKAFLNNLKSPNNQLISKYSPTWIEEGGRYFLQNSVAKRELSVDLKNKYLIYKDFEGWNGKCYPTFKVYTKADGQQILGVTEDSYTHHSYSSKYRPTPAPTRQIIKEGRGICPQHQWNQRPKPIKFWTYEAGIWTEVTEQVMTVFFSLEEMIVKTNTSSEDIQERIIHHIYPLYRIEAEKDEITVWVDGARNMLYTTEIEEFANSADNLTNRKKNLPIYWDYVGNTTYKSYTLVWDAKAGQFVRKK